MKKEEEEQGEEINDVESPRKNSIDVKDLYMFSPEDLVLNISSSHYSNITYMQVGPREVILDFLEMPGVKKDGKMVVNGVRIYLSHVGAQTLVEKLGALLQSAYNNGKIAQLEFNKLENVELSTEVNRPTEEEQS